MCFREKLVMTKLSETKKFINDYDDINSALHKVTSIQHIYRFLLKVIKVKLTLFHEKDMKQPGSEK